MNASTHANKRLQQRAMSLDDIEIIMAYGTPVPGGYLLRGQDINEAVSELKMQITALERLKGRVVIADGETVITAYPAGRRKQRNLLHKRH